MSENPNWCPECSPDNCAGCGKRAHETEVVKEKAYNELMDSLQEKNSKLTAARSVIEEAEKALSSCVTEETWFNEMHEKCGGQRRFNQTAVAKALTRIREWKESRK